MGIRTDLAVERREMAAENCEGVTSEELSVGSARITRIAVTSPAGAAAVGCSTQMIGFAVMSYRENRLGGDRFRG